MKNLERNEITWSDFLYSCLDKKVVTLRKLKSLFKFLDTDEVYFLDYQALK
jgi:hypothetical protein